MGAQTRASFEFCRTMLEELSWRHTLRHLLLGLHAVWLPLRPPVPRRWACLLLHPRLRGVRLPVQQDGQAGRPAASSPSVLVRRHSDGQPRSAYDRSQPVVQEALGVVLGATTLGGASPCMPTESVSARSV